MKYKIKDLLRQANIYKVRNSRKRKWRGDERLKIIQLLSQGNFPRLKGYGFPDWKDSENC